MPRKLLQPKQPAAAGRSDDLRLPFPGSAVAMTEKLLHFIWAFGYFNKSSLTTTEGEPIMIVVPGTLNKNQGPDFHTARIRIGDTLLAGTVELHLKTSDWRRHRHQADENYRNVILHAVYEHDERVNDVPVLELSPRISSVLLERYASFMGNAAFIPCAGSIAGIRELTWKGWKERLLVQRLVRKADHVLALFKQSGCHWEETFWWLLARAFGSQTNGEAFEAMARSIPVNLLAKHKASIHQLEALLFGQAGLLAAGFNDDYPALLQREYRFLQGKYKLQPAALPVLFSRMRPGNFPTVRLAQLAALVQHADHLFPTILEARNVAEINELFGVTANDYWHYHYNFGQMSSFKKKTVGAEMAAGILINTVVPMLFAYGLFHKNEALREKALRWLDELPPENNRITGGFVALGIENRSAFDSQALLELKNEYCSAKRCLECAVGTSLLREATGVYGSGLAGERR